MVGKKTKVVNLKNAFVLPGFHDCHLHPHFIFRDKVADRLSLSPSDTQEQVLNKIAEYAKKHPDGWIAGSVWNGANFEGGRLTAAMIEKVAPGRPVWLKDTTGHNAAASKEALKLAGITKTPHLHSVASLRRARMENRLAISRTTLRRWSAVYCPVHRSKSTRSASPWPWRSCVPTG